MSMDSTLVWARANGSSFSSGVTSALRNKQVDPRSILKKSADVVAHADHMRQEQQRGGVLASGSPLNWSMLTPSSEARSLSPSPRTTRATPSEPLIHHQNLPKEGTVSPLLFDEFCTTEDDHKQVAPPVCEIRIPTPQQQEDDSVCSITGDTAPLANCGDDEDYKSLYFCAQREVHALQDHVSGVKEENRQLKRQLIEMQKQLFSYSRNKRQAVSSSATNSAWSIPQCPSNKRGRTRLESIGEKEAVPMAASSLATATPPVPMSSKGVPMSVSTEEYALELCHAKSHC